MQQLSRQNDHGPLGFTIPELLTSIVIFTTLALIVLANFRTGGLNDDLRFSAEQLVGHLRRVQNLATVGQAVVYEGASTVPPGGYGVSVKWIPDVPLTTDEDGNTLFGYSVNYLIFADFETWDDVNSVCTKKSGNGLYDPPVPPPPAVPICGDQLIEAESVIFRSQVAISAMRMTKWEGTGTLLRPIDITFRPPHPTPLILGASGTVDIELVHTQTKKCRTITINAISGQISERAGSIGTQCYDPTAT